MSEPSEQAVSSGRVAKSLQVRAAYPDFLNVVVADGFFISRMDQHAQIDIFTLNLRAVHEAVKDTQEGEIAATVTLAIRTDLKKLERLRDEISNLLEKMNSGV